MESLENTSICQIKAVPGLFIGDRFAARSYPLLETLNITHVLSITRSEDVPKFDSLDPTTRPIAAHIDIDDDPLEDILFHLSFACDWIDAVILPNATVDDGEDTKPKSDGVLVHCTQRISRSGAFVTAYLMRRFLLSYSSALAKACESRPRLRPNAGFARQLRIWESCKYNIYISGNTTCSSGAQEKEQYKTWKAERDDNMLRRGQEAISKSWFSPAAMMAPRFGKQKTDIRGKGGEEGDQESDEEKQQQFLEER